jgi:signal recognition particle receptor subunit beta
VELLLFGTPGQARFRFMWDVLARGADAKVLVVDAAEPHTWADAAAMAEHFARLGDAPFVVAANRALPGDDRLADLRDRLALGPATPVVACQLVERESVRDLLTEVLLRVLEELELPDDEPAAFGDF